MKFDRIVRDPEICGGQPTVKGTRVLVLDLLDWIREGKSFEEIVNNYPSITKDDLREIIDYAKNMIGGEIIEYGTAAN